MMTVYNHDLPIRLISNYMDGLVGQFFKILPMKENGEDTLSRYLESLQRELVGCKELCVALDCDKQFLCLIAILQYLITHDCDTPIVKAEVFKAISICKKLQLRYGDDSF